MASSITVQNLIDWGRTHAKLIPLVNVGAFNALEPGLSIANDTLQAIICHPYKWKWNRATATSFLTVDGTAEYTISNPTDCFFYLDRAFIEYEASTSTPKSPRYPLSCVSDLQSNDSRGSPLNAICIDRWTGTNKKDVVVRFDMVPDATVYRVYVDYQQKPTILTSLSDVFTPVPDDMGRFLRQMFLVQVLKYYEDPRYLNELKIAQDILDNYRKVYDVEPPYDSAIVPASSLFIG